MQQIFWYIIVVVVSISVFSRVSIGFNTVFGLLVACSLIYYLQSNGKGNSEVTRENFNAKVTSIRPPINRIKGYPELVDFLFSIQEFYSFNPQNYEDMVDSIDDLMELYEETIKINRLAGNNYPLAEQKKSDALNALHSFTYNIPAAMHKYNSDKLNMARSRLDFILSSYLYDILDINKDMIGKFGYSRDTVVISEGPKASNYYNIYSAYTYDIQ
jgi:hypothetical protein